MYSRPLLVDLDELMKHTFNPDFLEDYEVQKEYNAIAFPDVFGEEIPTSIFSDTDRVHGIKTRQAMTGLLVLFDNAPLLWQSNIYANSQKVRVVFKRKH